MSKQSTQGPGEKAKGAGLQTTTGPAGRSLARGEGPLGLGPFSMMRRMAEEMDQLFREFGLGLGLGPSTQLAGWSPQLEAFQRGEQFVVRAELPGLSKEDIQVELTEDGLILQGERRQQSEEQQEGLYRSERRYGSFYRELPLPEGVKADQATASYNDGVLEIAMPLAAQQSRGRRLEIRQGSGKESPPVH